MLPFASLFSALDNRLAGATDSVVVLVGTAIVAGLGLADYEVAAFFSFTVAYVVPVGLVAWYARKRRWMYAMAIAASGASLAARLADLDRISTWLQDWEAVGRCALYVLLGYLMVQLRTALELQKTMARTDALTGLANLRAMDEIAEAEVERTRRFGRPMTIAFLDIDAFKKINDSYGHAFGDLVLRETAEHFQRGLRSTDSIARAGGDEFIVVMPETSARAAREVLGRLRTLTLNANKEIVVTFSIGAVTVLRSGFSCRELLETADRLMYVAKRRGPGQFEQLVLPSAKAA